MTKRKTTTRRSAGVALRDYLAASVASAVYHDYVADARDKGWADDWHHTVAHDAYLIADAMLKAREEE